MNIAPRVQGYLAAQQSTYELLSHPRSGNSVQSARAAHVPAEVPRAHFSRPD